ncbi:MAG: beta-ketoacyl synthase chain length factor [Kiritimatiellae bacterium]|nr:beta-ketoacyl synthase chain length factor [Kiritimatiellia bacterium]
MEKPPKQTSIDWKISPSLLLRRHLLAPGAPLDLAFVPPLARRRLSPLQRAAFSALHAIAADLPPAYAIHFASAGGELHLTDRLLSDWQTARLVSPARFSASVHNAAPGAWTVLAHNHHPYTAQAAGPDTPELSLLDALLAPGLRLWLYAEEQPAPHALALLLADPAVPLPPDAPELPPLAQLAFLPPDPSATPPPPPFATFADFFATLPPPAPAALPCPHCTLQLAPCPCP